MATWIISSDGYYPYCSNCGYEPPYTKEDNRTPYCPKCGEKMELENRNQCKNCEQRFC